MKERRTLMKIPKDKFQRIQPPGFRLGRVMKLLLPVLLCFPWLKAHGLDYEVGPGKTYAEVTDVPWEALAAGDVVNIYWRATPYRGKWVIFRQGTEQQPIVVHGVPAADGKLPVIDGKGARTPKK